MADKKWQAGGKVSTPAVLAACLVAAAVSCEGLSAAPAIESSDISKGFADPNAIWQILIGGLVIFSFLTAIILWVMAALRNVRRVYMRNTAFLHNSLNNMSQGIVMVNPAGKVVFCNERYLEIYGLSPSDVYKGMNGRDLLELRYKRGLQHTGTDESPEAIAASGGRVCRLPNGRAIRVKHRRLPTGGTVSLHEDCTEERRLSTQLASTKAFLESVIDNIPVCVAAKNIEDGRYILANRAFEQFWQLPRDQVIGKTASELFSRKTAATLNATDTAGIESQEAPFHSEFAVEVGSDLRTVSSRRVVAFNVEQKPEFLIALFEDITERKSMSQELENSKKFLDLIVNNVPVALTVERINDGQYLLANRRAEAILNRKREDVIGLKSADIFAPGEAKLMASRDQAAIRKGGMVTEEYPIGTKDGLRLFLTRRKTVPDENGAPQYLIKTHEDVTDRRQTESRMAHMAYHDGLTDLPNRSAFLKALSQMIDACEGTADEFAVLSVDLDGLKEINDVFGHAVGDKLLVEVARRMQMVAREGIVARLSGDEFGLIIDGAQPDAGKALAVLLAEAMASEFRIDEKSVLTGLTTGIAIFPRNGTDPASLLANAGAALFRAKTKSRGSINIFEPEMDQAIRDRRALHQDLSSAIKNGELSLHYQPLAKAFQDIGGCDVIGFEALARWVHPLRGFIPPGDFIPLAEESGLIVEMGEWILREACKEAASWPKPLQIAVNLSPAQFVHGDLVGLVHSILLETGLHPSRLELEITEGVLIEDFDRGLALLRRLKGLGVRISMDDFGSGYSSLTYLQAFPFDKIKIDRAFVMNLGRNPQSAAIVRAVIGLGHGLEILIVAEGVETAEQLQFLADEGCDVVQGYFIGKPGPIRQYPLIVGRAAGTPDQPARMTG